MGNWRCINNGRIPISPFTEKVHALLSPDGILIRLGGFKLLQTDEVKAVTDDTARVFGNKRVLQVTFCGVATYYGGPFTLVIAGKGEMPTPQYSGKSRVHTRWWKWG